MMMNPAEFTLPGVMYFDVGTPENPIITPFTQSPKPEIQTEVQAVNVPVPAAEEPNTQNSSRNKHILNAAEIGNASKTAEKSVSQTATANVPNEEAKNSMFSPKTSKLAQQLIM